MIRNIIFSLFVIVCTLVGCKRGGIMIETSFSETRTLFARVSETGTIQPTIDVPVAPDVSGEVVTIAVAEGQKVKKGDLLITIRPDDYRAQLEQAEASLSRAKAAYLQAKASTSQAEATLMQDSISLKRTEGLFRDKVVSQVEMENAQLRYNVSKSQLASAEYNGQAAFYQMRSAEASRKQARQSLDRTNIYASMEGTLTLLNVELGQRVVGTSMMSGTEILKISDLNRMEVVVEINENDIVNVHFNDSARIEVDAYPDRVFYGKVSEIAYSATTAGIAATDQVTNFEVKVAISPESYEEMMKENPSIKSPFRPGMTALVEIYTDKQENVVAVPIEAITLRGQENEGGVAIGGEEVVFLFDGQKVTRQTVETGINDGEYIHIKSGLNTNQEIVTGPYTILSNTLTSEMEVEKKTEENQSGRSGG